MLKLLLIFSCFTTLLICSVTALEDVKNLTKTLYVTLEAETEVNASLHEMSTGESILTSTVVSEIAETESPTTSATTLMATTMTTTTENDVTTLNPLEYENNNNDNETTGTPTTDIPTTDIPTTDIPTTTAMPSPSINVSISLDPYCEPSLCERFNGTHTLVLPHIACHNHGNFAPSCGTQPHLLYMSERRRNLILDLHNLARSRIASGQVADYRPAMHMPQLKWDSELEYLATLHAKRCKFTHDLCRNAARFPHSGQNIGYFWIRREIKSHSRRIKNFIVNWFKEYLNANQTFIDSYHFHPEGKLIGHFTQMVSDRVHRVGCAAIRFNEPDELNVTKLLLTCNYDYTNIFDEPIYKSGPTASKCAFKRSEKFPELCDWNEAVYEYDPEEYSDDCNTLDNNILLE